MRQPYANFQNITPITTNPQPTPSPNPDNHNLLYLGEHMNHIARIILEECSYPLSRTVFKRFLNQLMRHKYA